MRYESTFLEENMEFKNPKKCKTLILGNAHCPLYDQEEELTIHMLWNCKASNNIQAHSNLPTHKWARYLEDFGSLWQWCTT